MASLLHAVTKLWDAICRCFGCRVPPPAAEDAIHEFFRYGSQYYLAGRYGMFAGLMPVAANLHHHGIEMLLKGALSKTMALEDLNWKLKSFASLLRALLRGRRSSNFSPRGLKRFVAICL
jgi:hypothetical protein